MENAGVWKSEDFSLAVFLSHMIYAVLEKLFNLSEVPFSYLQNEFCFFRMYGG